MISTLKNLFLKVFKSGKPGKGETQPRLDFSKSVKKEALHSFKADADVHKLMIKATRIRKEKGYSSAIKFLQDLAGHYLREQNTAMVACMNKLIPYMKRDDNIKDEEIINYLEAYIRKVPDTDPYFLNLHIIMADLLKSIELEKAIQYLQEFLTKYEHNISSYNHQIFLAELYIEKNQPEKVKEILKQTKELIQNKALERTDHIKKERKWHRTCAKLNFTLPGETYKSKYIFHRYMEFALDMARVLDPMQIKHFHDRKDLYYTQKRGFAQDDKYLQAISELGIDEAKDSLLKDIYGFSFEEMPAILGVSKKQFNYQQGDAESLEELRVKKMYYKKAFTEINILEERISKIIKNYMKWGGGGNC